MKVIKHDKLLIGVISDTHGTLHSEIIKIFKDVDLIIHAGDIGNPDIIEDLQTIASVVAIRGNMDFEAWANEFPETQDVPASETLIHVIHNVSNFDIKSDSANFNAVIHGHTHKPCIENRHNMLFLNPGSASLPQIDQSPSVALLRVSGTLLDAQIIEITK